MIREYTYKFRLYPTEDQKIRLAKHFGCVRFIYNYFLNLRTQIYREAKEKDVKKKALTYCEMGKELTRLKSQPETAWLYDCHSHALQHAMKHLDSAFNMFFRNKQAYHIPSRVQVENNRLVIGRFTEGIKVEQHRPLEGEIRHATISKNAAGQYFVAVYVRREIQPKPRLNKTVGVDLGLKTFVVCSDGQTYPNIRPLKSLEARLKLRHKELSRTQPKSTGRFKARLKLAKLYQKVANIRSNHLHQISSRIVNDNQVIVIEDLAVKNMMANHKLAKSIADCSWSEFVRQLKYKAEWYGRKLVQVGRFFPSSKMCHECGFINQSLTLEDREWTCPRCSAKLDRDLNAAQNILRQGLNLLNLTAGTAGLVACPDVRPT
jgi:putative transposase